VQLYCVGFHCLPLHVSAYMAIFRVVGFFLYFHMLKRFCFDAFLVRCLSAPMWSHTACFPSVGCVKYEVLLFAVYAIYVIFGAVIYVFFLLLFCSCVDFLRYFCGFLVCVFVCLLFLHCLSVLCCYLLSISCSILNIGLLGSMALSFMCSRMMWVLIRLRNVTIVG
jgi:hypothetical protein